MFHLTVTIAANVGGILPWIVLRILAFVERLKNDILEFPQSDCLQLVPFLDATPDLFLLQNTKTPVLTLQNVLCAQCSRRSELRPADFVSGWI